MERVEYICRERRKRRIGQYAHRSNHRNHERDKRKRAYLLLLTASQMKEHGVFVTTGFLLAMDRSVVWVLVYGVHVMVVLLTDLAILLILVLSFPLFLGARERSSAVKGKF